jgi:hypothetical protein
LKTAHPGVRLFWVENHPISLNIIVLDRITRNFLLQLSSIMDEQSKEKEGEVRDQTKQFLPLRTVRPRLHEATVDDFLAKASKSMDQDKNEVRIEEVDEDDQEDAFISIGIDFGAT